jgi:hypothetical protein
MEYFDLRDHVQKIDYHIDMDLNDWYLRKKNDFLIQYIYIFVHLSFLSFLSRGLLSSFSTYDIRSSMRIIEILFFFFYYCAFWKENTWRHFLCFKFHVISSKRMHPGYPLTCLCLLIIFFVCVWILHKRGWFSSK